MTRATDAPRPATGTAGPPTDARRAVAGVAGPPGGEARSLADRQADLVAALTSAAPVPHGFDERLVGVARAALLRKRAGEVARQWPLLAAGFGVEWTRTFARWAVRRPTNGSLRDGWDLARSLGDALPELAEVELAAREAQWRYDGVSAPRRRRLPAVRRAGRAVAVQVAGRMRVRAGRS